MAGGGTGQSNTTVTFEGERGEISFFCGEHTEDAVRARLNTIPGQPPAKGIKIKVWNWLENRDVSKKPILTFIM